MTGSTTVDSNFLLAHKEQLDEVFQVYLDDINPFIVQFEIIKTNFRLSFKMRSAQCMGIWPGPQ